MLAGCVPVYDLTILVLSMDNVLCDKSCTNWEQGLISQNANMFEIENMPVVICTEICYFYFHALPLIATKQK